MRRNHIFMNVKEEVEKRVEFIKQVLKESRADGIILGNSGGKDCALVTILSKMATDNVVNVIMPCESKRNYTVDRDDALKLSKKFDIETYEIDLTDTKLMLKDAVKDYCGDKSNMHFNNMNPRLRMITLYTIAQSKNLLVAGTGNLSEMTMGYFTKWGDGAYDFDPISDLTVSEVYEMLRYLDAPTEIIEKEPSAGLYEGQTDEKEMGVTYASIEEFIKTGKGPDSDKIKSVYLKTAHKRSLPKVYRRIELDVE